MKSIFNNFFRIISLKSINIRQYRSQNDYYPAVFVIVGKTSITIPVSERYNLYRVHIRHYIDTLSRIEIMNYFLRNTKNQDVKQKLKQMIEIENNELHNKWRFLIGSRQGIKRRIELNNILSSIGVNADKFLNEIIEKHPEEFRYTNLYTKHQLHTKSCKLIDNKTVRELLNQIIKSVRNDSMYKYKGIVIDGYPLSVEQAELLIETCLKYNFKPVLALEVYIPDEDLFRSAHQESISNGAFLKLEVKDPRYHINALKERIRIYNENINDVKRFLKEHNIVVHQLNVPNTPNTYMTEQELFSITDKLMYLHYIIKYKF